ncbi:hypothetical protein [Sandaracinus amylolyticus]|uniref:hypothetical protein n=1 Tax=Sandaracinus amylolyticus TaxID=927083 RepID=UPI0012EEB700|nr:hypothetical protein [Sandaracinus amylolyticus]
MERDRWASAYRYLRSFVEGAFVEDDAPAPREAPATWRERVDAVQLVSRALADAVADEHEPRRRRALQVALARCITLGVEARENAARDELREG